MIAIENRLGLKYWAGCTEDHVGKYFEGLENYPDTRSVRTFPERNCLILLTRLVNLRLLLLSISGLQIPDDYLFRQASAEERRASG
mgnify:CR=1 FL=1